MKFLKALLLFFALSNLSHAADDQQIYNAIQMDNVSYLKKAIQSGSHTVDSKLAVLGFRALPLIVAAGKEASIETLKFLIANRANLDARNDTGETALMWASFFPDSGASDSIDRTNDRHVEAVTLLIEAGASLENEPGAFTPLAYAAYAQFENIMRLLLDAGANPNGAARNGVSEANPPLIMATLASHPKDDELVRLLLERGADPRIQNGQGKNALFYALRDQKNAIVALLQCALNLKAGERFADSCR